MILATLLLLAQDVPAKAPPEEEIEEVVIQATFGTTTMLFDKGVDGRLRNCRVMVSSGSQRRDTNACQATPVCYERTRDTVTECIELNAIEPVLAGSQSASAVSKSQIFEMPKLVQPKPVPPPTLVGPAEIADTGDADKQRVKKLPPLPQDVSNGPVIRITNGNAQDK
ncbi:MAG: hypothetical protein EOP60_11605 [Sphingomonadales bacterium]|nr:MAG: hypothetical protein EOP60_11605 [Sphingomonadales bacterium]